MTTLKNLGGLSSSALLVSLNVSAWSAVKVDKSLSHDVEIQHNMGADSGRYSKNLLAKGALERITKTAGMLRTYWREQTLPWLDGGVRILPAANYTNFKDGITRLLDDYESAVQILCQDFESEKDKARIRLNGTFRESDYPTDIKEKFGAEVRYLPLPDSSDFRVEVSIREREILQAQIAESLALASKQAMADLWSRLATTVKAMASKLAEYHVEMVNGKEKVKNPFRDSLVSNLQTVCDMIPALDFSKSPDLERVRQDVIQTLLSCSAVDLRDDATLRADVVKRAEKIAADISEFM